MRTEEEIKELLLKTKEAIKNVPEMSRAIFSQNPIHACLTSVIETLEWVLESEANNDNI